MMKVNLNLDNFCPICYDEERVMRNVYRKLDDKSGDLYCPKHGLIMSEDIDLTRYVERTIDNGTSEDTTTAVVGKAVVGKAVIPN